MSLFKKFFLVLSLVSVSCATNLDKYIADKVSKMPSLEGEYYQDVPYKKVCMGNTTFDIYLPLEKKFEKAPVYIFIHGGAWLFGNSDFVRFQDENINTPLRKKGYAVVSIGYRFIQMTPFPGISKDISDAIVFLQTNADKYKIDMSRTVLHGQSAGAHLALVQAFNHPTGVLGLIDEYGPTDLVLLSEKHPQMKFAPKYQRRNCSPVNFVNNQIPSIYILHGDADEIVPFEQSTNLAKELDKKNGKYIFQIVKDGNHGFMNISKEENKKLEIQKLNYVLDCFK